MQITLSIDGQIYDRCAAYWFTEDVLLPWQRPWAHWLLEHLPGCPFEHVHWQETICCKKCVHILIRGCTSINPALEVVKTDEWKVRTQSLVKGIQQCWAASCSSIKFDLRLSPAMNPLITALMSQSALCWAKGKHKSSQLRGLQSSRPTFSVNLYIILSICAVITNFTVRIMAR